MLINKTHQKWCFVTMLLLMVSAGLYVLYATSMPDGPSGGSWQGLLFGIVASLCMVYAGLLSGRKALPGSKLGSVSFWLKGHLWIGSLSVPLIFFHTGFRFGGTFEILLMICFLLVILSGIFGLVVQQLLPRLMTSNVPAQAIAEQIPVACRRLLETVDREVLPVCSPSLIQAQASNSGSYTPESELYRFYMEIARPFLQPEFHLRHPFLSRTFALASFSQLEGSLPKRLQPALHEIRVACEERRQMISQGRIQNWLHVWLFLHIPLSTALLVLGIVHAAMSLYY